MIICPDCKHENVDGMRRCEVCGTSLVKVTTPAEPPTAAPAPPIPSTPSEPPAPAAGPTLSAAVSSFPMPAKNLRPTSSFDKQAAPLPPSQFTDNQPTTIPLPGIEPLQHRPSSPANPSSNPVNAPSKPNLNNNSPTMIPVTPSIENLKQSAPSAQEKVHASVPASGSGYKLVITRGVKLGESFPLVLGENEIGRLDEEANSFPHIDLDSQDAEGFVHRRHAIVGFNNGQWSLEDAGGANGTRLRRRGTITKLTPGMPMPLQEGDEILVGRVYLRFEQG